MGLRFRKSLKIAPGVKLNLNKKSISMTTGIKGAHFTASSTGKKTASVGIPGTGLYFTKALNKKKTTSSPKSNGTSSPDAEPLTTVPTPEPEDNKDKNNQKKKWYHRSWFVILMLLFFFPVGVYLMWRYSNWGKIPKIVISGFFALFTAAMFIPITHPEEMVLSIEYQEEYNINTELPFVLTITPEDASTASVEYITSDETISVSDNIIYIGEKEGSFEIFAQDGEIVSNTIIINVVDIEAREAAKAEEERLQKEAKEKAAAEAEAQRLAEETAAKEAEKKRLAEEAEAKRIVEEQSAKEAAEKAAIATGGSAVVESQTSNSQPSDTSSGASSSSGNENNFNAYNNPEQQQATSSYVLNTNTMKFHYPSCKSVAKIKPENYSTANSTRDTLITQGYSPCGNCKP